MSIFEDTDSDDATIIIDGGPGDMSERTNSRFNPDAHEVFDVYDSSDDEDEEDHKYEEDPEDQAGGFVCPICTTKTNEEKKIVQCSSGHSVCIGCLKRYLSFKRLKAGDPGLSCCLFVWCYGKY